MANEIRALPLPKPLGASVPSANTSALISASNVLREAIASAALDKATADITKVAAWGNIARGFTPDVKVADRSFDFAGKDLIERFPFDKIPPMFFDDPTGAKDAQTFPGEEPFLHVKFTTQEKSWVTGRYTERTLHYSDIDRPVGSGANSIQLDGRILELAYCGRRVATEGGIARIQTTLVLQNVDGALNWIFRDPVFLKARVDIKVGFRTIPPEWYRRVGPVWRVDRINAITPERVELTLIDATDGLLGTMQEPPLKSEFKKALDKYLTSQPDRRQFYHDSWHDVAPSNVKVVDGAASSPYLNVPFGGEWVPAEVYVDEAFVRYDGNNYSSGHQGARITAGFLCLGATKNPTATLGDTLANIGRGTTNYPWLLARLIQDDRSRELRIQVGPHAIAGDAALDGKDFPGWAKLDTVQPDQGRIFNLPVKAPNGDAWYVAVLECRQWVLWRNLVLQIKKGVLRVQWPYGAEGISESQGVAWRGKHDPVSLIQHIAANYMGKGAHHYLDEPSFNRARAEFTWVGTSMKGCGGTYQFGDDGADVITNIAKTFGLDLWWSADGRLHIQVQYPDRVAMMSKSVGALHYDAQWDVVRGTWNETVPIGAERWGIANRYKLSGLKEYTRLGFEADLGLDRRDDYVAQWGRVLEVDIAWDWIVSCFVTNNGQPFYTPAFRTTNRLQQRSVVSFHAPLFALELDVGDYLRVSHFAGFQDDYREGVLSPTGMGYERRLFRVEEVGLDWNGKRCKLVVVDMANDEYDTTGVFDDESKWSRIVRLEDDGANKVAVTGTAATLTGSAFKGAGIKAGDLLLLDGGRLDARIETYNAATGAITLDVALPAGTYGAFNIQRTHTDPPTDAEFPGQYPLGSDIYFRACDETTGLFLDGKPGFKVEGA